MKRGFRGIYDLLKPHVRPRVGALVLIVVLASLAAFGLRAPLLLLDPLWNDVMFPDPAVAEAVETANFAQRTFTDAFDSVNGHVTAMVFGADAAADELRLGALCTVAVLLVLLAAITALAHFAFQSLSRAVALRLVVDLRQRLAEHVLGLSMRYHAEKRFGDLLSRLAEDVNKTLSVVRESLHDLVLQPLLVLGSICVSAVAAPWPTLIVVIAMPPIFVPYLLLRRRVRRRSRRSLSSLGSSVQVLAQMLQGIRAVKAFRAEERELERYRAVNDEYVRDSMKMEYAMAQSRAATIFLSHMLFALLLVGTCWLTIRLALFDDGAILMQFFAGLALASTHVRRFMDALNRAQESSGAAERLEAVLAERPDIVEKPGAPAIGSLGSGIRFRDVSFAYPSADGDAIHHVSIDVQPGERLAIVGPSGAGKTTFVDLVARFIDPTEGAIEVDGRDLREVSLDSWTSLLAMVGQTPFLFHASILENIRYGSPEASRVEVEEAAKAANIHEFVQSLPEGYDTIVGESGERLSGGQRQRITIARAVLKGAPLLLLDEATSALDSESETLVQEALDHLMTGRTVIVIAHRFSTIRNADRIAVLEHGRLVEVGTHLELLEKGGVYARLHAVQRDESGATAV